MRLGLGLGCLEAFELGARSEALQGALRRHGPPSPGHATPRWVSRDEPLPRISSARQHLNASLRLAPRAFEPEPISVQDFPSTFVRNIHRTQTEWGVGDHCVSNAAFLAAQEPDPEEGVDLLADKGAAAAKAENGSAGAGATGAREREGLGPRCQRSLRRLAARVPTLPRPSMPTMAMPTMPAMPSVRPHLASLKLANPFSKKKERDVEAGPAVTSEGGAPAETTPVQEDAQGDKDKEIAKAKEALGLEIVETIKGAKEDEADGMETVQLEVSAARAAPTRHPLVTTVRRPPLRQRRTISP